MVELVKSGLRVWEIRSLRPGPVKPMTYKIDTRPLLVGCFVLIGYGKDWLAESQDILIDSDIRS